LEEVISARDLLERTSRLLERQIRHPFVRGLGDGTLDLARFQRWMVQDWLYLVGYARSVALAVAQAPNLPAMTRWAELLLLTLHEEMHGHRAFAARFGVTDLDRAVPLPVTGAYLRFLLDRAAGSYAGIVAAHLPCAWDYHALAVHLRGIAGVEGRYGEWIRLYADPAFGNAAAWLRDELDRVLPDSDVGEVCRVFEKAREFELLFWDMCWDPAGDST
jgi:thiaminase/transcriptional activator TenA